MLTAWAALLWIGFVASTPVLEQGFVSRITNGTIAPEGCAPFLAHILIPTHPPHYSACGGVIIGDTTVITAAHCVLNLATGAIYEPSSIYVHYGSNLESEQKYVQAIKAVRHPDFSADLGPAGRGAVIVNDIAVVTIPPLVLDSHHVEPIAIYNGKLSPLQQVTLYGWGNTRTAAKSNAMLLMTGTAYLGFSNDCKQVAPNFTTNNGLQFCISHDLHPGIGSCQGDSGSGITIDHNGTAYVAGLVSFGTNIRGEATCGESGSFSLNTHILPHLDWLQQVTGMAFVTGPF